VRKSAPAEFARDKNIPIGGHFLISGREVADNSPYSIQKFTVWAERRFSNVEVKNQPHQPQAFDNIAIFCRVPKLCKLPKLRTSTLWGPPPRLGCIHVTDGNLDSPQLRGTT